MSRYNRTHFSATDLEGLRRLLAQDLASIQKALEDLEIIRARIEESHREPDKFTNGDIVFADGTDWNPESGEGIYFYSDTLEKWVKLGPALGTHTRLKWYYGINPGIHPVGRT